QWNQIRGIYNVSEGDEDDLAIALINYGPVGAGIDISASDFKQYRSGIYDNINCTSSGISHAVLIVGFGYDSEQKKEFWVIQNSWGVSWGQNGLMQLARHSQDRCGISSYAFAAVV
ncbi:MAG: putative cathepsin K, partial [Streblomastix strix]